jgi:hypothetical protein
MAQTTDKWTPAHEDALSAMSALGISKKEATNLLKQVPGTTSSELAHNALRARSTKPAVSEPQGAVKVAPISSPGAPPRPPIMPAQPQSWFGKKPSPESGAMILPESMRYSLQGPPAAPSASPAVKLPSPESGAMILSQPGPPAAPVKPRIRVPAAGGQIPSEAPKANTPVSVQTEAELVKLPSGTHFVWSDGNRYVRK